MLTKLVFLQSFYDVLVDQKKKRKGITAETKKRTTNKQKRAKRTLKVIQVIDEKEMKADFSFSFLY